MNFSSISFVALFIITYGLVLLFDSEHICEKLSERTQLKCKHAILLLASYVFLWLVGFPILLFNAFSYRNCLDLRKKH